MAQNLVGRTLGRTYRLERLLGTGSVGSVYVARHVRTGGLCAVRVVPRALVRGADLFARFQEETRLVATLRHPYILSTTDVDWDEERDLYVVTDLVEGESLAQRLRQVGSLPLSQALELSRQVGSALHAAHRLGVLHRDLRPESIFLCRSDLFMGADRVVEIARVGDFGMAHLRRADGEAGVYVAPEVVHGERPDGRADEWALGAVLYRALAGHAPLDEGEGMAPLHQLAPEVPGHVAAAIERALAERREERFDTVLDLIRALSGRPAPTVVSGLLDPSSMDGAPLRSALGMDSPALRTPRLSSSSGLGRLPGISGLSESSDSWTRGQVGIGPIEGLDAAGSPPIPPSAQSPVALGMMLPREAPSSRRRWLPVLAGLCAVLLGTSVAGLTLLLPGRRPPPGRSSAPRTAGGQAVQLRPASLAAAQQPAMPAQQPAMPAQQPAMPMRQPVVPTQQPVAPMRQPVVPAQQPVAPMRQPVVPTQQPAQPTSTQQPAMQAQQPPAPDAPARALRPEPTSEQLLRQAQDLFAAGSRDRALYLGVRAAELRGPNEINSWRFVGSAACGQHDLRLAGRAIRHLEAEDREFLISLCRSWGIAYAEGRFVLPAEPGP